MSSLSERSGFNAAGLSLAMLMLVYAFATLSVEGVFVRMPLMVGSAAVSITAGVAPNEINVLAQQLHEKEVALQTREQALVAQERDMASESVRQSVTRRGGEISLFVSMLLFVLIGINFYLDRRRVTGAALAGVQQSQAATVDMRA